MDYIYQYVTGWIQNNNDFRTGFIVAGILFLVIFFIMYIFQILSRKRVREIIIPGDKGALVVSASAVSDMVYTVVAHKIKCITIKKIILWKEKTGIAMELQGSYDIDGGRLPEVADEMRQAILKNLDGQLGITNVKQVIPNIKKITSKNLNSAKFK